MQPSTTNPPLPTCPGNIHPLRYAGKENITIIPGKDNDLPFLREMLFEAAFWRPDQQRPTLEEGLARADLAYLLKGWGRKGDTAVIAITRDRQKVGAAWYRFWNAKQHSYGYVSSQIPELGIAVQEAYRGSGIGHLLMESLLKTASEQGVEKISLSVEVDNPALNLYQSHGFETVEKVGNSLTMVAITKQMEDVGK